MNGQEQPRKRASRPKVKTGCKTCKFVCPDSLRCFLARVEN